MEFSLKTADDREMGMALEKNKKGKQERYSKNGNQIEKSGAGFSNQSD